MRAAIYTRVSSEDQLNGHSLEAQARLVAQFCNIREWEIVKVYEERGRSGKNIFRPEFQEMLLDAESHKFDVLVVHKLDRFSRSIIDTHTYIKKLDAMNVAFVSATEPFDLTSPMGKAFLGILAIFAELYLDNLAAEISKGKKQRALKGYWNGTLSWGYTTTKRLQEMVLALNQSFKSGMVVETEYSRRADLIDDALEMAVAKTDTAAIPDPFNAPGVQLAYSQYSSGYFSDRDIAHLLTEAGFRISARLGTNLLSKDTMEDILQNRFYIGETSYGRKVKGQERKWMQGNHEAIIDRELFDQCQEVRRSRGLRYVRGSSKQKSIFILDMLVCTECGTRFVGWHGRGQRKYRDAAADKERACNQSPKYIDADEIERQLIEPLTNLKLPKGWQKRVLEHFSDQENPSEALKTRASIEGKLMRLQEIYVVGDISKSDYEARRKGLRSELDSLTSLTARGIDIKRMGEMLEDMSNIWSVATLPEQKKVLQMIYRNVYIEGGDIKAVEPTEVMWVLLSTVMQRETGRTGFEPAIRSYPRITA